MNTFSEKCLSAPGYLPRPLVGSLAVPLSLGLLLLFFLLHFGGVEEGVGFPLQGRRGRLKYLHEISK